MVQTAASKINKSDNRGHLKLWKASPKDTSKTWWVAPFCSTKLLYKMQKGKINSPLKHIGIACSAMYGLALAGVDKRLASL